MTTPTLWQNITKKPGSSEIAKPYVTKNIGAFRFDHLSMQEIGIALAGSDEEEDSEWEDALDGKKTSPGGRPRPPKRVGSNHTTFMHSLIPYLGVVL